MIPARRMRAAFWELDRDVSQNQMKNYISDCGLRVTDNLTLAEFARCYYYLFFDTERDGSVGGSYHKKIFKTEGSSTRYSDDTEPLTISECAQRVFAQGWNGTSNSEINMFMRRLSIGRSEAEIIALNVACVTFEQLDEDDDGELQTADIIPFFRQLKVNATSQFGKSNASVGTNKSEKRKARQKDAESKSNKKSLAKNDISSSRRQVMSLQPVKLSYTDSSISAAVKRFTDKTNRAPRDGITFPEILAEFGYIFESVSCKATVASAFSELRLHASLNDVQNAAEFVVNILNKVLENPFDKKFWRVKEMSDTFYTKLGRFAGGSTLLQAVGFKRERDPGSAEFYYYLKWPKGKAPNEKMIAAIDSTNNTVSPALDNALKTLRGFRAEVETEIKHLNGGMATVSEAISALHTKTETGNIHPMR